MVSSFVESVLPATSLLPPVWQCGLLEADFLADRACINTQQRIDRTGSEQPRDNQYQADPADHCLQADKDIPHEHRTNNHPDDAVHVACIPGQ
jgi:hypothetical protein